MIWNKNYSPLLAYLSSQRMQISSTDDDFLQLSYRDIL